MPERDQIDLYAVPSPCWVLERRRLHENLDILDRVQRESGARILLALKGFAMWSVFDDIGNVLRGTAASGLYESRLGRERMDAEVHCFSPAYTEGDFGDILEYADHLVFNSAAQWRQFGERARAAGKSCGLRINPQYSEVEPPIYNPCVPGSRFGIRADQLDETLLDGVEGLHFHTHCEQNSDALERTLAHVEAGFGWALGRMRWVNFGGGHHITRADYDIERLIGLIRDFSERYDVQVYLEPGEAVGWQTGPLICSVVDIVENDMQIAVLDVSITCHMPDCLEMPYRPDIAGAGEPGEHPWCYRLAGNSCLAGDVLGDFSFERPLRPGDRLRIEDMLHYTTVKTTSFNGIALPAMGIWEPDGFFRLVRAPRYADYADRLS